MFVSVVDKNEPVMLAQCPICDGTRLYVIERFVTLEDRRDFADQEKKGYAIMRMTLHKAGTIGECMCTDDKLKHHHEQRSEKSSRPRKPVLSLGRKQPSSVSC
jgi:hypothetical protein